jgi:hypothetical protein
MFLVDSGKCLPRKPVQNWVDKFSQGRSKVADDETEVRKWLRQQSKDFYAAGFDALVRRWDKCINFGREINVFFFSQVRISHDFLRFISICDVFTDSPSLLL